MRRRTWLSGSLTKVSDAELTLAVILVFANVENASGHRAPGLFGYPESGILNMKFDRVGARLSWPSAPLKH